MENCIHLREDAVFGVKISCCALEKQAIRNGLAASGCRWDGIYSLDKNAHSLNKTSRPCYSCFVSLEDEEVERIESKAW